MRADPGFRAALAKRGIDDPELVHIEAWSIGDMAPEGSKDRRLVWTPCWVKSDPADNHYAHPIRGLHAIVDLQTMEVVELEDHGVTPLPPRAGQLRARRTSAATATTCARSRSCSRRARASRSTAGRCAGRSGGSASASTSARGSTLHEVGYEDGGRVRPIAHRALDRRARHPVRRPRAGRVPQERVRHRRVRARPAHELARARLRLSRRDPLPRRRPRRRPAAR